MVRFYQLGVVRAATPSVACAQNSSLSSTSDKPGRLGLFKTNTVICKRTKAFGQPQWNMSCFESVIVDRLSFSGGCKRHHLHWPRVTEMEVAREAHSQCITLYHSRHILDLLSPVGISLLGHTNHLRPRPARHLPLRIKPPPQYEEQVGAITNGSKINYLSRNLSIGIFFSRCFHLQLWTEPWSAGSSSPWLILVNHA